MQQQSTENNPKSYFLDRNGEWSEWTKEWDDQNKCNRKKRKCEKHCGDGVNCPGDEEDNSECNGKSI